MNQPPNNSPDESNNAPDQPINPADSSDQEYLPVEHSREESERLRKSTQQLKRAHRRMVFNRIIGGIYLLVGLLEVLLGLRFLLRLFGANPDNFFAQFIYGLSEPFVAPFSTLFVSPATNSEASLGKNIFDVNLLIAMIIYGITCLLAVSITRYIEENL